MIFMTQIMAGLLSGGLRLETLEDVDLHEGEHQRQQISHGHTLHNVEVERHQKQQVDSLPVEHHDVFVLVARVWELLRPNVVEEVLRVFVPIHQQEVGERHAHAPLHVALFGCAYLVIIDVEVEVSVNLRLAEDHRK